MSFNLAVQIVSGVWLLSEILLSRMKHSGGSDGMDKSSLLILWAVIGCSVAIGVYVGMQGPGHIQIGGPAHRYPAYLGLVLIVLGLCLRWAAILTLKSRFTTDVHIADDHSLVESGLYRYMRHPAYAGSLLSFLGLGLTFMNWLSILLLLVPVTAAFLYRMSVEERALTLHFGKTYEEYCARTKRIVPGVY